MKTFVMSLVAFLLTAPAIAGETAVELKQNKDTVDITVGGKPFAVFNYNSELPKPFMFPVRGPDGTVIARRIIMENGSERENLGHKHHKGIFVAVDEINKIKFWAEQGKIKNVSVKPMVAKGNPAKLHVVNHWLGEDGKPVVIETTIIGIHANRLMTYDITFTAGASPVTFEDTKEGLFGFRMVQSMREDHTGHVVNADGLEGTKACWGKTSDWVDYYGEVDGKIYGITLMDHPDNFRKSRYHVRNYGLFSVSPFGEKAYTNGKNEAKPLELDPKGKVRLRYGLYIHAGDTKTAGVAKTYSQYLKASK